MDGPAGGVDPAVFAWIEAETRVVGAAWVRAPQPMVVSVMPIGAVGGLATLLAARRVAVPAIGGPSAVVAEFARHWTDLTGRPALRRRERQVLRCDAVSWPSRSPGRARPARPGELDLIAGWLVESPPDTDLAGAPGRRAAAAALAAAHAAGRLLVWEDAGPVGAASWPQPVAQVARPAIWMRPGYRGRGYEPALVAAVTARALASGCVAGLCHSDHASARAAVLPQVGYRFVQDVAECQFGPEPAGCRVATVHVRRPVWTVQDGAEPGSAGPVGPAGGIVVDLAVYRRARPSFLPSADRARWPMPAPGISQEAS
jgi:GNAT superfamily N-acetyltransferase